MHPLSLLLRAPLFRPGLAASVLLHGAAVTAALVLVAPSEPPEPRDRGAWVALVPSPPEPAAPSAEEDAPPTLPDRPDVEAPPRLPDLPPVEAVLVEPDQAMPSLEEQPETPPVPALRLPSPTARVTPRRATAPPAPPAPPAAPPPRSAERSAVLSPPRPSATNLPPVYPAAARARGVEGVVHLLVTIEADGSVGAASLAASSGHALLDAAALDAVRAWRFSPALLDGVPARTTYRLPVSFRLS